MTQVVLGVDPDEVDPAAIEWAVRFAALVEGELTVVGSWRPAQAEVPPATYEGLEEGARERIAARLDPALREIGTAIPWEVRVSEESVGDALLDAVDDLGAELLVVGHPSEALARLTAEAERLANRAPCPVVVTHEHRDEVEDLSGPVVAAIDGADGDPSVIAWAQHLAGPAGVIAAYVEPPQDRSYPHPPGATRTAEKLASLERELEGAGTGPGIGPVRFVLVAGDPAQALGELAAEQAAATVVVGRGRGRLLDKVPARLIEAGTTDVVVVPDDHDAGPAAVRDRGTHLRGLLHRALGWATADRRVEAEGELELLDAADPEGGDRAGRSGTAAAEALDEAELRVRSDHGDLAPDAEPGDRPPRDRRPTEGG